MIQSYQSTMSFFHEKLREIIAARSTHFHPSTEYYIVNLLASLTKLDQKVKHHQTLQDEVPLAFLYAQACDAPNMYEKIKNFKALGDHTLSVSGLFGDHLKDKVIDLDYYMSMGSNAYTVLSSISDNQQMTEIFVELSGKVVLIVDVLAELSEGFRTTKNDDLIRLYDRWLYTRSARLYKKLKAQGIDPESIANPNGDH